MPEGRFSLKIPTGAQRTVPARPYLLRQRMHISGASL